MNNSVTINDLKNNIALKDLPDQHLEWILAHSSYEEHEDGDIIVKTGEPIDDMIFFLEGMMNFYMNVNGQLVYYHTISNNELTGGVTGVLPYSRLKNSPGNSYAVGKIRIIKLHKKYFQELEQLNSSFIQRLIAYMTERARFFATTKMQQEKVSALGKLAAGIAHELNNPAAAIDRISDELDQRLNLNFALTEGLLRYNITSENILNIREIAENKKKTNSVKTKMSPLQRLQKEDELNEWLIKKEIKNNAIAETFIDSGFSCDDLEKINENVGDEAFPYILNWLENILSSRRIIKDLEDASGRISMLVGAIKSHVQMDRAGDLYYTDLHKDIEDTFILLGYKIREKNIKVKKVFCENLPEVEVYIGALNQVWTNIIDNAIYAVPQNGEIEIETICDNKKVTVRIRDNGSGIPKEILSRIFDPFFTTKKVGEGTGIGLDIVKTVINQHHGEVEVESIPGKTQFVISLPVSQH